MRTTSKDWLKNDPGVVGPTIATLEMTIHAEPDLAVCVDPANGAKHFTLTSTKTGDLNTAVTARA